MRRLTSMDAALPSSPPPPDTRGPLARRDLVSWGVALALLGVILTVAARWDGETTTARLGQKVELVELIRVEQARVAALERRVEELAAAVAEHEGQSTGVAPVAVLQEQVDELAAPAGFTPVRGSGVIASLNDSPLTAAPSGDLNDLVIHEQDLQAVINALWAGGAEAMSVNGQRILATTAIRCVGNTLLLHGRVYSPPYVIHAIGDDAALRDALDRDPLVTRLRVDAQRFGLRVSFAAAEKLEVPAADGAARLRIARPLEREAA